MSDLLIRDLERRALQGDRVALDQLRVAWLRVSDADWEALSVGVYGGWAPEGRYKVKVDDVVHSTHPLKGGWMVQILGFICEIERTTENALVGDRIQFVFRQGQIAAEERLRRFLLTALDAEHLIGSSRGPLGPDEERAAFALLRGKTIPIRGDRVVRRDGTREFTAFSVVPRVKPVPDVAAGHARPIENHDPL